MKNKIAFFVVIIMLMTMIPLSALAADSTISTNSTHDLSEYGNNSTVTINAGLTVTLTNTSDTTYTNLRIDCGAGTALTIDGIKIDNSTNASACALSFTGSGNTLTLVDKSILSSGSCEPGIRVEEGTELTISGSGEVEANGGDNGAGIGGGEKSSAGSITISDGQVTARSGQYAAGIGGGESGNGGIITISGGSVTASSPDEGAGIGGGYDGTGGTIKITGGTVVATGGPYGAGIGGGTNSAGGDITISGGTITASSLERGAGIGGGYQAAGGTIKIESGTIEARGGRNASGIGGSENGDSGTIEILDGTVEAIGGEDGAGIGGGKNGSVGTITIAGGDVTVTGQGGAAGIGGGYQGTGGTINISGGDINATGGNGAGIGYGDEGGDGVMTINISGGSIYAISGDEGAGIGAGDEPNGTGPDNSTINITGGYIEAYGYCCGSAIGAGDDAHWGTVNLSGGVINADSYEDDIGDGCCGEIKGGVTISGTAIVFVRSNELYDGADIGTHRFVTATLNEMGDPLAEDTEVVLESTDGLYAKTFVGDNDPGEVYAYIPDGTYFFSKEGEKRTQAFTVSGADVSESLDFAVYLKDETYTLNSGSTEIYTEGAVTIVSDGTEYTDVIIRCAAGGDLTIQDVNIKNAKDIPLIVFEGAGSTLTVLGTNTLDNGSTNYPAVTVQDTAEVTIDGTGSLTATGGNDSAGIGGGQNGSAGTITIAGGDITATGSDDGAGIGGGQDGSVGTINIRGGTVTAESEGDGAGIGGGYRGSGGTINISGGDINAIGGDGGAGIGYGDEGGDGAMTINISGGNIYAISEDEGAGIGAGDEPNSTGSDNSIINITGGYIEAYGYCCGSAIGAGDDAHWGTVNLSGGVINADAYEDDIGDGCCGEIKGGVNISGTAIVFVRNNELYDGADIGTHRFVTATLNELGNPLPEDTEVILESTDGLYAKTFVTDIDRRTDADNGKIYAYIPDGTYFFSKDGGEKKTRNFTVAGGDVSLSLEFVSVLLDDLEVSGGVLTGFDSLTFGYEETVDNSVAGITVTPTAKDANDTLTVSGTAVVSGNASNPIPLNTGENTIEVIVTDGTETDVQNTYTITVIREYLVTYDNNGGDTEADPQTVSVGAGSTLTQPAEPTKAGYRFEGWYKEAQCENVWDFDTDTVTSNLTLYAKWEALVEAVSIPETLTLDVGASSTLTATITPNNASNKGVTWESSDTSVASVNANGKVTGIKRGTATITVTTEDGGYTDTCEISVEQRVTGVDISAASAALILDDGYTTNDTVQLTATVSPSDADNQDVTWKSSDTSVATVDSNGLVTAVAAGSADITVTTEDGGHTDTCRITVLQRVTGVDINLASATLVMNDGYIANNRVQLSATVSPSDADNQDIVWESSNTSVATVNSNGLVTAVAAGSATITVTTDDGGHTDTCDIRVRYAESDSDDNDEEETPEPTPTQTPAPTATNIPDEPLPEQEQTSATPEEKEIVVIPEAVEEDDEAGTITIRINVKDLPEGTKAIKTANGDIIKLDGSNTIQLVIRKEDLGSSGEIQLVALGEEDIPLGTIRVQIVTADSVPVSGEDNAWDRVWPVLMWVLIGLACAAAIAGALVLILRKKKA